jgi:hypothetical protein
LAEEPAKTHGADAASLADVDTIDALLLAALYETTGRCDEAWEWRRKLATAGIVS